MVTTLPGVPAVRGCEAGAAWVLGGRGVGVRRVKWGREADAARARKGTERAEKGKKEVRTVKRAGH